MVIPEGSPWSKQYANIALKGKCRNAPRKEQHPDSLLCTFVPVMRADVVLSVTGGGASGSQQPCHNKFNEPYYRYSKVSIER